MHDDEPDTNASHTLTQDADQHPRCARTSLHERSWDALEPHASVYGREAHRECIAVLLHKAEWPRVGHAQLHRQARLSGRHLQ